MIVVNVYLYGKMVETNDRYMRAFMAKNLTDYTQNDLIKEDKPLPKKEDEFVPLEGADESVFSKYLKLANDGQNSDSNTEI